MISQILNWLTQAIIVLGYSHRFMVWNLFLAFIPLSLSFWLFRLHKKLDLIWWFALLIFIVFLPNAPYVLTDVIHLINLIRYQLSIWIITLVLIPQYTLFILAGFQAYVISIINLVFYLEKRQLNQYIIPVELTIHALCAVGIYLGRFQRFNSWDLLTQPKFLMRSLIENLLNKEPILVIIITFIILTILYWFVKQVNLGIYSRLKSEK